MRSESNLFLKTPRGNLRRIAIASSSPGLFSHWMPNLEEVADQLLNQEIWVSWPHMVEAKVVSVSNQHHTYALTKEGAVFVEATKKDNFLSDVKSISEAYKSRWGVVIGNTSIVLNACEISGRK